MHKIWRKMRWLIKPRPQAMAMITILQIGIKPANELRYPSPLSFSPRFAERLIAATKTKKRPHLQKQKFKKRDDGLAPDAKKKKNEGVPKDSAIHQYVTRAWAGIGPRLQKEGRVHRLWTTH